MHQNNQYYFAVLVKGFLNALHTILLINIFYDIFKAPPVEGTDETSDIEVTEDLPNEPDFLLLHSRVQSKLTAIN